MDVSDIGRTIEKPAKRRRCGEAIGGPVLDLAWFGAAEGEDDMLLGRGDEALGVDNQVVVLEGLEELVETELFFSAALRLGIIGFVGDDGGDGEGFGVDGAEAGGSRVRSSWHGDVGDGLKLSARCCARQGITFLETKCKEE